MKNHLPIIKACIFFLAGSLLWACNSRKETFTSRGMQNLTARYNILYNANLILKESESDLTAGYIDNYDKLLPVFREPDEIFGEAEAKKLDEVIAKALKIANEKDQSKYVDDAYFVIGKANHLKANFYNAVEFFSYVIKNYPDEKELKQAALLWQARSFMASERFEEAESALDTALKYIDRDKDTKPEIYAASAQLHLYAQQDTAAIALLEKARKLSKYKQQKIRWTYILGQLEEMAGNNAAADDYFYAVTKSNASFELAFNATLNLIRTSQSANGKPVDKIQQLRSLLKDDKNVDFTDQIYFQIASEYLREQNIDLALENYKISAAKSTRNLNQKGLSYLKLADINFDRGNYIDAKRYYDSTLTVLPKTYPNYVQIKKKADNLDLLADRLNIIAREDTLQMLALLPEEDREQRIGQLIREQARKSIAAPTNSGNLQNSPFLNSQQTLVVQSPVAGKFYFYNIAALSQGLSDFKRKWGDRKLEDNWRRSEKAATDLVNNSMNGPDDIVTGIPNTSSKSIVSAEDLRSVFMEGLPLTTQQKAVSDARIISAYYDIGNFYRDVLTDNGRAIATYEQLLSRYPENENKTAVYYNLYRLYLPTDQQKSDYYKNILLKDYSDTPFARIIQNPNYSRESDERQTALNNFYNETYQTYVSKGYPEVVSRTQLSQKQFGDNNLSSQIAYLNALAIGHTQKLGPFEEALKNIVVNYPDDRLVTPIVKENLAYVDANRDKMSKRPTALVAFDPNEPPFIEEPQNTGTDQQVIAANPATSQPADQPASGAPEKIIAKPDQPVKDIEEHPLVTNAIPKEEAIFTETDATNYFVVVNVLDAGVNLSPSRFGIGQFNRTNLPGREIKHQLKNVNNQNQLIYIGTFNNIDEAKAYYNNITPLMKDIMKIGADRYNTFIITKQNLDKLNDRAMVDKYIEYFKRSY